MHTWAEIIAMVRGGELMPLTAETLPAAMARQQKSNARLAAAMAHGYVGGNPLPQFGTGLAPAIIARVNIPPASPALYSDQAKALMDALERTRRRRKGPAKIQKKRFF
jgi:hypothetical protein